ncbi:MAG: hypothetical protein ABFQ65_03575 [Nanoarchaeota archaeon]
MEESNLEELKKKYYFIKNKYNLSTFDELNKDFYIEKIAEIETDYLIREIRKLITDRFANYLRFVETFLQPSHAPMFVLSIVKLITNDERKKLFDIYGRLAKSEMKVVELDLEFSEEKEAEFIKESYNLWQEIKKDLLIFVRKIEVNWDHKPEVNGKNYFG